MNKKRIEDMEKNFDLTREDIKLLKKAINKVKKDKKKISEVSRYYGSEEWFNDRDNFDNSIKAGILSEDLPYDTFIDLHDIAIDMIEKGLDLLKISR